MKKDFYTKSMIVRDNRYDGEESISNARQGRLAFQDSHQHYPFPDVDGCGWDIATPRIRFSTTPAWKKISLAEYRP